MGSAGVYVRELTWPVSAPPPPPAGKDGSKGSTIWAELGQLGGDWVRSLQGRFKLTKDARSRVHGYVPTSVLERAMEDISHVSSPTKQRRWSAASEDSAAPGAHVHLNRVHPATRDLATEVEAGAGLSRPSEGKDGVAARQDSKALVLDRGQVLEKHALQHALRELAKQSEVEGVLQGSQLTADQLGAALFHHFKVRRE